MASKNLRPWKGRHSIVLFNQGSQYINPTVFYYSILWPVIKDPVPFYGTSIKRLNKRRIFSVYILESNSILDDPIVYDAKDHVTEWPYQFSCNVYKMYLDMHGELSCYHVHWCLPTRKLMESRLFKFIQDSSLFISQPVIITFVC